MTAYIKDLYFNEVYFAQAPLYDTAAERNVHRLRMQNTEDLVLNIVGMGPCHLQIDLRRNREKKACMVFSVYDGEFRLMERKEVSLARMGAAMTAGDATLSAIVSEVLRPWFMADQKEFFAVVMQGARACLKHIVAENAAAAQERESGRTRRVSRPEPRNPLHRNPVAGGGQRAA